MRRAKWGVGAAVVVGLAWVISNFFNMGGLGTGERTQIGLPTASTVPTGTARPENPPAQEEPETAVETATVATAGEDRSIGEGGVVEVMIDDRSFLLRRGSGEDDEWVPADADAIAAYARQAPGDDSGVRVRIRRKPSARASSEDELNEALRGVGLTAAEIDVPAKLLE